MSTLHGLLVASAARHPERTAVEDSGSGSIRYADLDDRSDLLCEALMRLGVGVGDRVGICARKSIDAVVSIFGILKAGAAYVPVDAGAPSSRNAYILCDCAVKAVVAGPELVEGLRPEMRGALCAPVTTDGGHLVIVPVAKAPSSADSDSAEPVSGPAPDGLSYILYTSGSTGRPKGVVHTHESALSFIDWCSTAFEPDENDRFSSHAPFHFDLSILDLYLPIKHGATLVLVDEELGKQPLRLAPFVAERRISIWYSTPSILRMLVEYGRLERYDFSALRTVLFAGEVFPVKHLRALKEAWPAPRYFNLYGPTETNVCTCYEIPPGIPSERSQPFPIGRACSGDRTRVVDEEGRELPAGEEGELLVAGGSVMPGYWNLPERTSAAFHRDTSDAPWYRTGDVVCEDEGGNYVFVGRRDRMVKRRGYRVELGEIESALHRHPSVREAAVVASPDEESGVRIEAFLSWSGQDRPSVIELKGFCARNLPSYMAPDRFTFLPSLPKTSTDKVHYQRLKELV